MLVVINTHEFCTLSEQIKSGDKYRERELLFQHEHARNERSLGFKVNIYALLSLYRTQLGIIQYVRFSLPAASLLA